MTTITATGTAQQAATAAKAQSATLGGDFNTFLTLLTTQLKNQDPTQAMDTETMVNQLTQFASVEQQISMNTNLEKLIGLQQASSLTAAAPLVGKTVEIESDRLPLQDGKAVLRLPAAGAATVAQVTIADATGRVVRQQEVTLGGAAQDWAWDGKDSAGKAQADGVYSYSVAGRDAAGTAQDVTATVLGRVTGAERTAAAQGGDLQLVLGKLSVDFDAVRSLAQ
ncbi:flagellar hook assembly protein FlgD [Roseicella aquatilis]|nr:flagellar hook capping FlgD N-terminal domain-containing protein [Roseicella aquatilis]